ncbi:MAG: lysophospholipid acyltransferase family protein [Pirellulaceae bacterium]|nr:lysophospholipid acyltransferase family protein [Pirellulaceae bacterium]
MLSDWAAYGFLAAALVLPLAALAVGLALAVVRSKLTPLQCVLWGVAYLLVRLLWRASWSGALAVPPGRGSILVSNHRSSVDPFFLQTAADRPIHWMVAREFCQSRAFGWFLRACEVIPVGRGGIDTAATKEALRIVSAGGLVGMFPEGRINMTDDLLLPGRPGAAWLALRTRAIVIPCYIAGSPYRGTPWSPFLTPARVQVRFGLPLDLTAYHGRENEPGVVEEVMRKCLIAIAELAGQPAYEPKLAGRSWKPSEEELAALSAASAARRH